ncbi:nuclear inhibitor of protein phosphatase 1 [Vigna unguiculata]|uniref:Nuclear inhibitor of protein phosphatase 1 n=1 Tax=Vigna unguiculata TaxID=3917 RepID=A0A4D6N7Q5_VIGUN|nr:nuclear inhibitor of protein phosphatase 1 [Vigna unguiculata]
MADIAMAQTSNNNKNPEQEKHENFPVLTVLKNNAVLRNIFLVHDGNSEDQTVLIGRHPDCDIVLMHPSVSRFHLRIRSNPSSRTLSLVDLASVHGTWVRGMKLEPGVSVELKEGDTFTVGVSTRLYRLSWVPLTQLNVFVPHQQQKEDEQEEIIKDENLEYSLEQEIPEDEDVVSVCCDEESKSHSEDKGLGVINGTETSCFPTHSGDENIHCDRQISVLSPPHVLSPPCAKLVDELYYTEKIEACPKLEMPGETNLLCTFREYLTQSLCLPVVKAVQGTKMEQFQAPHGTIAKQPPSLEMLWSSLFTNIDPATFDERDVAAVAVIPSESDKVEDILTTEPRTFNSDNMCLIVEKDLSVSEFHQIEAVEEFSVDSVPEGEKQGEIHWSSLPTNIGPSSFDVKDVAAVAAIPTESEFGITHGDNDKVGNMCLMVDKDIPDSVFHQVEVTEEVSVDSIHDGEKHDECKEEYTSKLQDQNGKIFHEEGYSRDEIVEEDNGNKRVKSVEPASFIEKSLAVVTLILTEPEFGCTLGDKEMTEDILETESRTINPENTSLLYEEDIPVSKFQPINIVEDVMDSISDGKELESKLQASVDAKCCQESGNSVDEIADGKCCQESGNSVEEIAEDNEKNCTKSISSTSFHIESPNSSLLSEVFSNITAENQTPQSLTSVTGRSRGAFLEKHVESTEKSSTFGSIRSRGCKAASAPHVRARKSRSKVGTEVKKSNVKDAMNKSMPKDLSSLFDVEEKNFTSNKENLSSNSYHLQLMRKKAKLQEIKFPMSPRSPNLSCFSPSIHSSKSISTVSNKVNLTTKVAQELKSQRKPLKCLVNLVHEQDMMELKKRVERVPFRSVMNSGSNHNSVTISAAESMNDAGICGQISNKCTKPSQHTSREQKRSWDMVVDTASLVNKESRKALQLLQGLKGTRLIIPRSVIRELGCMKQQFRLFRRTLEATLALEWIKECMEKTSWWIHIMEEECRLTVPTLSASPQTQFVEESWAFPGFTTSPAVEDNILEFALQYRKKENVGQLVLLSHDVTLKVKSMAKGLLCETVQQFRQSLANPFSERFMWPKSSPRGLTWCCQDDLVLREKYCGLTSKTGLKVIS